MKDFIRSLSPDQLQGLIQFSKNKLRPAVTIAIEQHLEGNSEDFEFLFGDPADGNSKAKQTDSRKHSQNESDSLNPATKSYTDRKMEEYTKGVEAGKKMAEFNQSKNFAHLSGQRR